MRNANFVATQLIRSILGVHKWVCTNSRVVDRDFAGNVAASMSPAVDLYT
jgi:hypothetical protein